MKNEMTFYVGTDINKYKMDPDYFQIQCCDIISELASSLQKLMYNPTPPPPKASLYNLWTHLCFICNSCRYGYARAVLKIRFMERSY